MEQMNIFHRCLMPILCKAMRCAINGKAPQEGFTSGRVWPQRINLGLCSFSICRYLAEACDQRRDHESCRWPPDSLLTLAVDMQTCSMDIMRGLYTRAAPHLALLQKLPHSKYPAGKMDTALTEANASIPATMAVSPPTTLPPATPLKDLSPSSSSLEAPSFKSSQPDAPLIARDEPGDADSTAAVHASDASGASKPGPSLAANQATVIPAMGGSPGASAASSLVSEPSADSGHAELELHRHAQPNPDRRAPALAPQNESAPPMQHPLGQQLLHTPAGPAAASAAAAAPSAIGPALGHADSAAASSVPLSAPEAASAAAAVPTSAATSSSPLIQPAATAADLDQIKGQPADGAKAAGLPATADAEAGKLTADTCMGAVPPLPAPAQVQASS